MLKRQAFEKEIAQIPEKHLVFIDEAGTNLGMTRSCARSLEGERVYCKRPAARGSNISLVCSLRLNHEPVLYPFDGAVDGERFISFLSQHVLKTLVPGDVVVMDNCRIHHIQAVKDVLATAGAKPLFLPPYSPELNPCEETFSLIKGIFKKLEARTIAAYVDTLEIARSLVTPEKIKAYFDHAKSMLQAQQCAQ